MKRVDHMIRYLSGDLTREEAESFEMELSGDHQLKEEFDRVSFAYGLIGDQIRKRDEKAFRSAIIKAMDHPDEESKGRKTKWRWFLLIPVAASVAILLAILLVKPEPEKLYLSFYAPTEDGVVTGICQETRGPSVPAFASYMQGSYDSAFTITGKLVSGDPDNHQALLIHLLSAIELDREQEVFPLLEKAKAGNGHMLGQSLTWYHALALVKSDRIPEAAGKLQSLLGQPGPYREGAHKLGKMLTK